MASRMNGKHFWLLALLLMVSGISWADVTSQPIYAAVNLGALVDIPLTLNATQVIAGVNGQLDFDPALFSNPNIRQGPGANGFTVLGNQIPGGHYRFVAYSDPTAPMNLTLPVLYLQVTVASSITQSVVAELTYSIAAVGDPTGASLTPCSFAPVRLRLNSTSVNEWSIYE